MYIRRHIEIVIERQSNNFPIVIVTGARQVGKSTVYKEMFKNIKQVSLDTLIVRQAAINSPSLFFEIHQQPLVVDEIQRAPFLFEYLKEIVDNQKKYGQFFLTGSQSFTLMQNVSESLAGRAGIIKLLGLSLREITEVKYYQPFIPTKEHILSIMNKSKKFDYQRIIETIWQGSFPRLYQKKHTVDEWRDFYDSYLQTYIERDIKEIIKIQDEVAFLKFIKAVASLTGQQLNYTTLAEICSKDVTTIQRWISLLQTSGLVYLLQPYYNNFCKRIVKTPKIYFLDTGLACFLLGWNSSEQLVNGAAWGHIFETYIISEILKSYYNNGITHPPLYYYRDKEKNEIDLIIEEGNTLYPVEIKTTSDPTKSMISSFKVLDKISNKKVTNGAIICMCKEVLPLIDNIWIINPYLI